MEEKGPFLMARFLIYILLKVQGIQKKNSDQSICLS